MKGRYHVSCAKMLFLNDLLENRSLFQILHTSITIKNSESVVKSEYFENLSDEEHTFFWVIELRGNIKSLVSSCYFFPCLLGSQYLFEILKYCTPHSLCKCDKKRIFRKTFTMESSIFIKWRITISYLNGMSAFIWNIALLTHLKTSKNVVKSRCFWNFCHKEWSLLLNEGEVKMIRIKIFFSSFIKKSVFIWNISHLTYY